MITGSHERWHWLESPRHPIAVLLDECPQLFLNKYVVISSCDGGPFIPAGEQEQAGWESHGGLAYTPRLLTELKGLPRGEADEWYVFPQRDLIRHIEVFVNYTGFTLRDPQQLLDEGKESWFAEMIRQMQERFWLQLEMFSPEAYIADAGSLIVVTQDQTLFTA